MFSTRYKLPEISDEKIVKFYEFFRKNFVILLDLQALYSYNMSNDRDNLVNLGAFKHLKFTKGGFGHGRN